MAGPWVRRAREDERNLALPNGGNAQPKGPEAAPNPALVAGDEIKIADLARKLATICGFQGNLRFNPAFPDGQPRRMLDTTRARENFGFVAGTGFDEGLRRTAEWWRDRMRNGVPGGRW
mgnify:FL=1